MDNISTKSEQEQEPGAEPHKSAILGVSLRGWLVLILVITTCAMFFTEKKIPNELYMLMSGALGQYFTQVNTKDKIIN